jgi:hypothetical protein
MQFSPSRHLPLLHYRPRQNRWGCLHLFSPGKEKWRLIFRAWWHNIYQEIASSAYINEVSPRYRYTLLQVGQRFSHQSIFFSSLMAKTRGCWCIMEGKITAANNLVRLSLLIESKYYPYLKSYRNFSMKFQLFHTHGFVALLCNSVQPMLLMG